MDDSNRAAKVLVEGVQKLIVHLQKDRPMYEALIAWARPIDRELVDRIRAARNADAALLGYLKDKEEHFAAIAADAKATQAAIVRARQKLSDTTDGPIDLFVLVSRATRFAAEAARNGASPRLAEEIAGNALYEELVDRGLA